jgi:translation initiation factor IF-3
MSFQKNQTRVNQRIRAPEVRVIGHDGAQVGVMPVANALKMAVQLGLDLVEVSPEARPPVCRIIDFGKYRYEQAKKHKGDKNTSSSKLKELKFHVNISENDYTIKVRHATEFLQKNMRVKASLFFRGREMQHQQYGLQLMQRIIVDLAAFGHTDVAPKLLGKNLHVILVPGKAKPKISPSDNNSGNNHSHSTSSSSSPSNSSSSNTIKIDLKPSS